VKPFLLVLMITLAFSACNDSGSLFSSQDSRFVLLQGQRTLSDGTITPAILRMDSATGETWILDATQPPKWVGVKDDLGWRGKYDPKTGKIRWGVSLPDGRNLNELTREELVRLLASMVKTGRSAKEVLDKEAEGDQFILPPLPPQ